MVVKQIADLITALRGTLLVLFPLLGFFYREAALPWVAALLAANWTGDSIDGPIARRSGVVEQTWVGGHDLEIDMAVSFGLLIYMLMVGFLQPLVGVLYLLLWGLYFWRSGIPRATGMLFQAPIYGWFIYISIEHSPGAGWALVAWVVVAVLVTWPKFPKEVVPGFIQSFRSILTED